MLALSLGSLGDEAPQFNYSGWDCGQCTNPNNNLDETQQGLCAQACGNQAAQASLSPTTSATVVTSLPGGASVSSIPGLPGLPTSTTPATNWWRIGLAAAFGLGVVVYLFSKRSA